MIARVGTNFTGLTPPSSFESPAKQGLKEMEANDVVQETFIRVAKNLKAGKFDRNKGSFKAWLMNQCRWRIIDQFRARSKDLASSQPMRNDDGERRTDIIENFADPKGDQLERMWNREWSSNLTELALRAVKAKVAPLQYQIFLCYVVKEWGVDKVKEELGVHRYPGLSGKAPGLEESCAKR